MERGFQEEEVFESSDRVDEKDNDVRVNIEIDLKSISSFVRKHSDASLKMWKRAQRVNMKEGDLEGDEVNNFLHDVLKRWHEFRCPKDKSALVKAQTKMAVADLKKVIFSAQPGEIQDDQVLTKDYWIKFIEQMKKIEITDKVVPPETAFEFFAGKVFDPADSKAKGTGKSAKNVFTESPVQRHHRLMTEIEVFKNSLTDFLTEKQSALTELKRTTVTSMSKDLSIMNSQLVKLAKNLPVGEELDNKSLDTLGADMSVSSSLKATEPAIFTLLKRTDSVSGKARTLNNIEDRLGTLEKLVGEPEEENTMSTIEILSDLEMLSDPSKMDVLERRINSLTQNLDRLKRNRHLLKYVLTKRHSEKRDKLLEKMSKWDSNINKLPAIIENLKKQQPYNVQTAELVGQVNSLECQQKVLSSSLKESKYLLSSVLKSISLNTERIQANVNSLEERISRLTNS